MIELRKKGLAEIPATIFVLMVVMLLFLTLFVAGLEKRKFYSIAQSSMRVQQVYAEEKSAEYIVDVAFEKAVISAYGKMGDRWIADDCSEENGYKELCRIDEKLNENMEKEIKKSFLVEINKARGASKFFDEPISDIINNLDKNENFGIGFEDTGIKLETKIWLEFMGEMTDKIWFGLVKQGTVRDYVVYYTAKIEIDKKFSEIGLESFNKIFNAAAQCKHNLNSEECLADSLSNFDGSIDEKNNKLFIDLTSKKEFEIGKIKLKFYVIK